MLSGAHQNGPALFIILLFTLHADVWARQDASTDSLEIGAWDVQLIGKVAGTQSAFQNWTEGGLNTLAATASLDGKASSTANGWEQSFDLRLAFGIVKQDTLRLGKADDVIRFGSTLRYNGDDFFHTFSPTFAVAFRSQFASGYNYDKNPF